MKAEPMDQPRRPAPPPSHARRTLLARGTTQFGDFTPDDLKGLSAGEVRTLMLGANVGRQKWRKGDRGASNSALDRGDAVPVQP